MGQRQPILIVGAGPVGLGLALGLVRRGVSVRVIEVKPRVIRDPRANTFHPPTLEMFEEWGVREPLERHGLQVTRLEYWDRPKEKLLGELDYRLIAEDTRFPYRLHAPQYELCEILKERLTEFDHAELLFGHKLLSYEEDGDGIVATVQADDETKRIRTPYLVAADGVGSRIRTQADIGFAGDTYSDRFLTVEVGVVQNPQKPVPPVRYLFDPDEWAIVMHMQDAVRILFKVAEDSDPSKAMRPEILRSKVGELMGYDEDELEFRNRAVYTVTQRVASSYVKGRVILCGDAAHTTNPAGGMAMNCGIHDAHHLAVALHSTIALGGTDSLKRYAVSRKEDAVERVQLSSHESYKAMCARGPWKKMSRNRFLGKISAEPDLGRAHLLRLSMMEKRIDDLATDYE